MLAASVPNGGLCCGPTRAHAGRRGVVCMATPAPPAPAPPPMPEFPKVQATLVNALFGFQPFFKIAAKNARSMMVKRGDEMGRPWAPELERLEGHDWEAEMEAVADPALEMPAYYTKPFHAYESGNLSMQAALEVELAAVAVHSPVMDPEGKVFDPEGDKNLRASYSDALKSLLSEEKPGFAPEDVVDLGCATGMSARELRRAFPGSKLTGVDLSKHFLAAGVYKQRERRAAGKQEAPITFVHAPAERTGLPAASQDLVSLCLVCHELPRTATKEIVAEAMRLLRPGGVLSIMEMNPSSEFFQKRIATNVFAFTAFKSTEPYLDDYMTLDLHGLIRGEGFKFTREKESSPRHRTLIAIKPE